MWGDPGEATGRRRRGGTWRGGGGDDFASPLFGVFTKTKYSNCPESKSSKFSKGFFVTSLMASSSLMQESSQPVPSSTDSCSIFAVIDQPLISADCRTFISLKFSTASLFQAFCFFPHENALSFRTKNSPSDLRKVPYSGRS